MNLPTRMGEAYPEVKRSSMGLRGVLPALGLGLAVVVGLYLASADESVP